MEFAFVVTEKGAPTIKAGHVAERPAPNNVRNHSTRQIGSIRTEGQLIYRTEDEIMPDIVGSGAIVGPPIVVIRVDRSIPRGGSGPFVIVQRFGEGVRRVDIESPREATLQLHDPGEVI